MGGQTGEQCDLDVDFGNYDLLNVEAVEMAAEDNGNCPGGESRCRRLRQ